jgi:hypothetical protein
MAKKILAFCAALLAFAAMPAVAAATNSPELTENGTKVEVGKSIQATSVGETLLTDSSGNVVLRCDTATMSGSVTKNDGSNVEGNITAANFHNTGGGGCSGSLGSTVVVTTNPATNGLNWCIRSTSTMATHEFQVRGNSCSGLARPIRFILHAPFGNECVYQRTAAIPGTYTTGIGKTVLSISGVEFERLSGGFPCPAVGKLDMSFTLETGGTNTRVDII